MSDGTKERPRSGYEAVYADLLRTPEAEACVESLTYWCRGAALNGYSFRVSTDHDSGLARTTTCWKVVFGPVEQDFREDEYTNFRLDFDRALDSGDAAGRIVKPNFGVRGRVGTRNCSGDVVRAGKDCTRSRYGTYRDDAIRPFSQALIEHCNGHPRLSEEKRRAEARIVGEMVRIRESAGWAERRARALAEAARDEVRKVMLKFREVPDQVLAEAVREAAVEGVMDW